MKLVAIKDLYFLGVIGLINVVDWFLSPNLKQFVINSIGGAAYKFSSNKRRNMLRNVTLAFNGMLSERQRTEIVKGAFVAFWNYMFSWSESTKEREEYMNAELSGLEHLHQALRNANGVILWESNGFGNKILSKKILHEKGFLIYQVHGANNLGGFLIENSSATWARRTLINRFFENRERKFVAEIINLPRSNSLGFTRILLNRLNRNGIICVAGDGKTGQKMIPCRFLGRSEFFSTGIVSLAKISGAVILPMFCLREEDGKVKLVIEKPIKSQKNHDREESLGTSVVDYINILETYIRRYPEQYINWHLGWDTIRY